LLLKASHSLAQILGVVCRHLKLSDLIHDRLEVAETGDGPADLSIEHGNVFSSAPKQESRFDLFEADSLLKEPRRQVLVGWREWALHTASGLKQTAHLLGVGGLGVCGLRGSHALIGPESIADLDLAGSVLVHGWPDRTNFERTQLFQIRNDRSATLLQSLGEVYVTSPQASAAAIGAEAKVYV
jgi:hypothetical protein